MRWLLALAPAIALIGCAVNRPTETTWRALGDATYDVTFRFAPPIDGERVYLAAEFNGWDPRGQEMLDPDGDGLYEVTVQLPLGFHLYKFTVDGEDWFSDPNSVRITEDGNRNSILALGVNPADWMPPPPPTMEYRTADLGWSRVEVAHEAFAASGSDLAPRPIYAWLPPGYDPTLRYPVLYMHDGQNVFDDPVEPFGHGGWHTNIEAERLIGEGRLDPFLIVGVPCSVARMDEYGLGQDVMDASQHEYARYLIDDVMPFINARYPTLTGPENTALMGSSMGGLISFHLAYHFPEVFGTACCLSTAFMIPDGMERTALDLVRAQGKRPVRIYLDSGTAGPREDGAPLTREMRDVLLAQGWTLDEDLVWHEEAGAEHTERAWRARVWRPLLFLPWAH